MKKINKYFKLNKRTIGFFFLGIGLNMFLIDITVFINISKYYANSNILTNYYLSIFSSIILMIYSLYNIYDND